MKTQTPAREAPLTTGNQLWIIYGKNKVKQKKDNNLSKTSKEFS